MKICSQWFANRIRGMVENDIRIYLYPQKFTDIRKYLSAVPYPRNSDLVLIRQQRWRDGHSTCSSMETWLYILFVGILYWLRMFLCDPMVYFNPRLVRGVCLLWLLCTVPGSVLVFSLTLIAAFIVTRQCEAWHTCHAVPEYRILRMNSGII